MRKKVTYIQCQECGEIYSIPYEVEIDNLYIISECPYCGMSTGLNLGNNEEDRYELYNVNLDPRYYDYN